MNMSEVISGVTLTKACAVKPEKDSAESRTITLRVKFDGATIADVFEKAMASTVIQWQAKAREKFTSIVDKSTVEVNFIAPTRTDPEQAMIARLMAMTPEARVAYLKELEAKVKK